MMRKLIIKLTIVYKEKNYKKIWFVAFNLVYRRFVKGFSYIVTLLNELVKKNIVFKCDDLHD